MSTIGQRIKSRRKEKRLTQRSVAQFVGNSASAVTQWEQDTTQPNGENLLKLAKLLECSPEWLINGKSESEQVYSEPVSQRVFEIPLLSWVSAGFWMQSESVDIYSNISEWVETTLKLSKEAFALRVKGDSMTSPHGMSIPEGSIVIVEPCISSISEAQGKIVIAQQDGSGEATIKRLTKDGDDFYLLPLNPHFRTIPVDEHCKIIGVVKQIIIDF